MAHAKVARGGQPCPLATACFAVEVAREVSRRAEHKRKQMRAGVRRPPVNPLPACLYFNMLKLMTLSI